MSLHHNREIALFMGLEYTSFKGGQCQWRYADTKRIYRDGRGDFQFDWNTLMSAVEHIETLDYNFRIEGVEAEILYHPPRTLPISVIKIANEDTKLDAVYLAVREFVRIAKDDPKRLKPTWD